MKTRLSRSLIQDALKLDLPYPYPRPRSGIPCGVLLLVSLSDRRTVLIKRPEVPGDPHSGQIALPGGRVEDRDHKAGLEDIRKNLSEPAACIRAALREFEEETGFSAKHIEVLGLLPEISTPSGYRIFPSVALTSSPLEHALFRPDPCEVEGVLLPEIDHFLTQEPRTEMRQYGKRWPAFPVYFYSLGKHTVWGATAAILQNFASRIRKAQAD